MKHSSYRKADCCQTCEYCNGDGIALNYLYYCNEGHTEQQPDRRDYDNVDRYLDAVRHWERTNGVQGHYICDLFEKRI